MLVVNMEYVPGYEIREVLGEVHGVTARSRNVYNEGVKLISGGPNPRMIAALSRWRDDAIAQMSRMAYARGANAVVCMRFDHRDVSAMWTEICAYGTAVFVVPARPMPDVGQELAMELPARGSAQVTMQVPVPTD
jgi:uncharacterized protein YbjQ (UPF0145 family)